MTSAATPAAPAPTAPEPGDDRDLAARLVAEPLVPASPEVDDVYSALAALLLDAHATRAARGDSPTPSSDSKNLRPDAACREARSVAPPAGGEAA